MNFDLLLTLIELDLMQQMFVRGKKQKQTIITFDTFPKTHKLDKSIFSTNEETQQEVLKNFNIQVHLLNLIINSLL